LSIFVMSGEEAPMTAAEDEVRARVERARAVALFRYQLIREAADPGLSTRQRGRLVRELAGREHPGPFGVPVRVSRQSLDRWILAWRRGGFDALLPTPRQVTARTPGEVLDMAAALKRENPDRTAAQVVRILRTHLGWTPSESTVLRLFTRLELSRPQPGRTVFGRFEAARPNQLWTGDALHGPVVAGRKTYLFAFIDDHSRAVVGHRFGHAEDTVRLAAALRPALASRGVPEAVYVDNGSAFVDAWLRRALAVLGIKLTHSTPGAARRQRQNRTAVRDGAGPVPGRGHRHRRARPPPRRRSGRAEPAVHRLGRAGLPPPGALRDRAAPDRPLDRRRTVRLAEPGGAA
jgi:putative transposase